MPHSPHDRQLVLTRVRRLRGQVEALERALEAGLSARRSCSRSPQRAAQSVV